MCSGGRLLADFVAGTKEKPRVLELADSLTTTVDGRWVVWAFKLARIRGEQFIPLTGRGCYPVDATATCLAGSWRRHTAPDPLCSCGFHALSEPHLPGFSVRDYAYLTVALSGRVLAFEWHPGGVLLRAARQTVVRVDPRPMSLDEILSAWEAARRLPDDPEGRLARIRAGNPSGAGPASLQLPADCAEVAIADDPGGCHVSFERDFTWTEGELTFV